MAEACVDGTCGCDAPNLSYAGDVESLIVERCATMGCHRPMGANDGAEGLDLSLGQGFGALVGVTSVQCGELLMVSPGLPASSYLMNKLRGTEMCSGTIMPKNGSPFSAEELQLVEDWICAGASP